MFINNIQSKKVYIYQSWENLGTMNVSSRTGLISVIYRAGNKGDIEDYRAIFHL